MENEKIDFAVYADGCYRGSVVIDNSDIISVEIDVDHNCLPLADIKTFFEVLEVLAHKRRICYDLVVRKRDGSECRVCCCRG